ncbi:MAG: hypothetical protein H7146_10625 [Burkholderiaceae bacterium]|nr:hypothetical protein [Microbacteriaceae bacterium]
MEGPAHLTLRDTLERQGAVLFRVRARLDDADGLVGWEGGDAWRGPARLAYDAAAAELRRSIAAAASATDEAAGGTARAIAGLGG